MAVSEAARAPQRRAALDRANEVRLRRSELRREVRSAGTSVAGLRRAAEIVREREAAAETWEIFDFLISIRKVGVSTARRFLVRERINETTPLGALTDRRVGVVVSWLEESADRREDYALRHGRALSVRGSL